MLRISIVSMALALSVTALAVGQEAPNRGRGSLFGRSPTTPAGAPATAPPSLSLTPTPAVRAAPAPVPVQTTTIPSADNRTFQSGAVLPEPAAPEAMEAPTVTLPTTPIEPYLLQRHNGPFMVLAKTFRGPDAKRYAQALAMELRSKYQIPAYVWWLRLQPGHSNIHNVPPTAPNYVRGGETVQGTERVRSYDEAAVLVGDCKTIDESEELLHRVKKLHSVVLDGTPSIWNWKWRKGLNRAMLTTNPLRASQELFPIKDVDGEIVAHGSPTDGVPPAGAMAIQAGRAVDPYVLTARLLQNEEETDPLVKRMNDPKANERSLYNCPGPFALKVAEFRGRATTNQKDPRFSVSSLLKQSPLATAAEDAEQLAADLEKCKTLPKGLKPYVWHTRSASQVLLGPFQRPDGPNLSAVIDLLNKRVSVELITRHFTKLSLAPATQLTPVPRD